MAFALGVFVNSIFAKDVNLIAPEAMLAAGAAALARELPEAVAGQADLESAVQAAFADMWPHQWQPIATAPKDQEILLGLAGPEGFQRAIGQWDVHDEPPFDGGRWTVTVWWDAVPTHWMLIPPPPTE